MVDKVLQNDITNNVSDGEQLALLTNDLKRAVNETIDELPTTQVDSIEDLRSVTPVRDRQQYIVLNEAGADLTGGYYYYDASDTTSVDNSISIIVNPTSGYRFKQSKIYTSVAPITNITILRATEPAYDGQQVKTLGHTTPGLGSVVFRHDASDTTSVDNNGTVIVTSGGKRWIAVIDGFVTPEMFGGSGGVQAALNSVYDVVINGQYETGALTLNATKTITLNGALTLAPNTNATLLTIFADGAVIKGFGTLDGNKDVQTSNCSCVEVFANNVGLFDINIARGYQFGVRSKGSRNKLINVRVSDTGYVPVLIDSEIGQTYERNRIIGCEVDQSMRPTDHDGSAVTISGAFGVNKHNTITDLVVKMPLNTTVDNFIGLQTAGQAYYTTVSGLSTYGGSMGLSSNGSDYSSYNNISVESPSLYGIEMAGGRFKTGSGWVVDGGGIATRGVAFTSDEGPGIKSDMTFSAINIDNINGIGLSTISGYERINISSLNISDISGTGYALSLVGVSDSSITGGSFKDGTRAGFIENCNRLNIDGIVIDEFTSNGWQLRATSGVSDNISFSNLKFGSVVTNPFTSITAGSGSFGSNIQVDIKNLNGRIYSDYAGGVYEMWASGSPEGVQTGSVGSKYNRLNGGVGTTLYIKESGTGNTGWTAK